MYPDLKLPTNSYGSHFIEEDDVAIVTQVLRTANLTCGQFIEEFENKLATTVGAKYAVSCSNGTTALHLASIVAGVGPGDYVIVPTITFLATANTARFCDANVIFCDVDPENALVTYAAVLDAVKRSPKRPVALYLVDIAGQPSTSKEIYNFCRENDIKIIQDASHALGTVGVGNNEYADFTTFSFHPVKNITTGEGGAITTNDLNAYKRLRQLRSHGMLREEQYFQNQDLARCDQNDIPNPWYYEMQELGYNYRLTDLQAALGLSQLAKLTRFKQKRSAIKQMYDARLNGYEEFIRPIKVVANADVCWHLYLVLIDFETLNISRAHVMRELSKINIGSQVHYIPVHLQPYYSKFNPKLILPGAMEYYAKTLSLPLHMHLDADNVEYVTNSLLKILGIK